MPNLKYPELFTLAASVAFDVEHPPGAPAPHSGIYRCFCGHEVPAPEGESLPVEPHPGHPAGQSIAWRLVAAARRGDAGASLPQQTFKAPSGWPPSGG